MLVKSLKKEKSISEKTCLNKFSRLPYRYAQPMEDWWDTICEEERQGILRGLAQVEAGLTVPHSEVMKMFEKWL
ncbi:MAG: hypothetical protein LBN93_09245 [Candidatus Symbiothrix sp.]|jgi:hypothetical protein|nr:hypothetical protein [Candidatus Symbiothrix sp.]